MTRRVLFLCRGNSCRSQIAEAIVNARYPEWRAFSAGTHPVGFVHPLAIQVLSEIGIEHTGISKNVEEYHQNYFDLVVTVCDDAKEECPLWLGKGKRVHEGFIDPAKVKGTDQDKLIVFRKVRDEIISKIPRLLD
jgi:arsenate reductase